MVSVSLTAANDLTPVQIAVMMAGHPKNSHNVVISIRFDCSYFAWKMSVHAQANSSCNIIYNFRRNLYKLRPVLLTAEIYTLC